MRVNTRTARCSQLENKQSHPWGDQVDGPWELRRAVRQRLREDPDAIKIWATGGGIWRWAFLRRHF